MRTRTALELCLTVSLGLAGTLGVRSARADDDPGHRFGLVPSIGGGIAGLVHPGPLPGFVGFTDLGFEILGERRPWGGFLRMDFLSSGNEGRWTAYAFGAGTQYRLFGTTKRTALFLRGGITYERWLGNNEGCPITLLVPNSCNLMGVTPPVDPATPPPPPFSTTTDMVGLLAGARLEVPLTSFYLAFGATFVPTVGVDASSPSATFQLRFDITGGFRDTREDRGASRDDRNYRRRQ